MQSTGGTSTFSTVRRTQVEIAAQNDSAYVTIKFASFGSPVLSIIILRARRLGALFCVLVIVLSASASERALSKIEAPLAKRLARAKPSERIPVSIALAGSASRAEMLSAAQGLTGKERRDSLRRMLQLHAAGAQASLLARLEEARLAGQATERSSRFWIANVVTAELAPELIRELTAMDDVLRIHLLDSTPTVFSTGDSKSASDAPAECGVQTVRAPEFWSTHGSQGEGVLIALLDTGTCYTHPDIIDQIWINPGEDLDGDGVVMDPDDENGIDDDGNGFVDDLLGWDFYEGDNDPWHPNYSTHGSPTAGILVGDGSSGKQTGVAPGAKLMVIRIDGGGAGEVASWNALQYAVDNGAQIASMSYGWYHRENPDRVTWRELFDNITMMGLIPFVAVGNNKGNSPPEDVATPGDTPAAIGVGATDCGDLIASYSSQGPSSWSGVHPYNDYPYPPGLLKPNITAPAEPLDSIDQCSGYASFNGTSAAAPHAAGVGALLLSLKPDMSRNEMAHVLETTAIDLGDAGPDRVYGHGRIDAMAAADALSGWVNYAGHRLVDTPEGNGNGTIDPDERITLPVTLHNSMESGTATAVRAILSTRTAGVEIHDRVALLSDILAGSSAESLAPHFTFTTPDACDSYITFDLTTEYDNGSSTTDTFIVRVGHVIEEVIFEDDFESDKGWTRSGTASDGFWVREDPHEASTTGGDVTQPEDDHSESGAICWVTGNDYPIADASEDDVDNGREYLTSPRFDATGWTTGTIGYWYWTYNENYAGKWIVHISNDDGVTWDQLVVWDVTRSPWKHFEFPLPYTLPTDQMRLRFQMWGYSDENVADALVDDVMIVGQRVACDGYTPSPAQAPNGVGATLRLALEGEDIKLTWLASPVDATHDPAALYRIRRDGEANGPFDEFASATGLFSYDLGEASDPTPIRFYLVIAENAGGEQAPE